MTQGKIVIGTLVLIATLGCFAPSLAEAGETGNVAMISGGIGDDEMANIRSVQNHYNLKLMFTEGNGMYLSDVQVHITRKGQDVADTVTTGPVLLVNLPAGEYRVDAISSGESHSQRVSVGGGLKTYQFRYATRDTEE